MREAFGWAWHGACGVHLADHGLSFWACMVLFSMVLVRGAGTGHCLPALPGTFPGTGCGWARRGGGIARGRA